MFVCRHDKSDRSQTKSAGWYGRSGRSTPSADYVASSMGVYSQQLEGRGLEIAELARDPLVNRVLQWDKMVNIMGKLAGTCGDVPAFQYW